MKVPKSRGPTVTTLPLFSPGLGNTYLLSFLLGRSSRRQGGFRGWGIEQIIIIIIKKPWRLLMGRLGFLQKEKDVIKYIFFTLLPPKLSSIIIQITEATGSYKCSCYFQHKLQVKERALKLLTFTSSFGFSLLGSTLGGALEKKSRLFAQFD